MQERYPHDSNDLGSILRGLARKIEEQFGSTSASEKLTQQANWLSQYAEPVKPFDRHRPAEYLDPHDFSDQ